MSTSVRRVNSAGSRSFRIFAMLLGLSCFAAANALAQRTLYWDPSITGGTTGGGSGTWVTSASTNWWNNNSASEVPWTDVTGTDTAIFGGTAGTVSLSGYITANALTFNTAGYVLSNGTLTLAGLAPSITANANATLTSQLGGSAGLTELGTGTLYLTNSANNFSGGVNLNSGTLNFSSSALNSNAINCNGGTLQWATGNTQDVSSKISISSSTQTAYLNTNGNNVTFAAAISGSGGLTKVGNGILTLGANVNSPVNTYTGGTIVNAGTLVLNCNPGDTGVGTIRGVLTINPGATVQLNVPDAVGYNLGSQVSTVNIVGGTMYNNSSTEAFNTNFYLTGGTISGGGTYHFNSGYGVTTYGSTATSLISSSVVIRGSSNLAFNVAGGTTTSGVDLNVSGVIGYYGYGGTGGITKSGSGLMELTAANTYSAATLISGGTLRLGDGVSTNGSVAGPITDNATLVFANPNAQTYSGLISGGGSVAKIGAGTLTLSGSETYSGTTAVNAGNLAYSSSSAVSSNSITINPGGAVNVSGAYPTVTAWLGSNLINPASTGALALTGSSNETISMGSFSSLSLGAVAGGATYSGSLTPSGTTYYLGGGGGADPFLLAGRCQQPGGLRRRQRHPDPLRQQLL